jgi:hypothetical protein
MILQYGTRSLEMLSFCDVVRIERQTNDAYFVD